MEQTMGSGNAKLIYSIDGVDHTLVEGSVNEVHEPIWGAIEPLKNLEGFNETEFGKAQETSEAFASGSPTETAS